MATLELLVMATMGAVLGGAWATWYSLHRVAFWQQRADELAREVSSLRDQVLEREIAAARLTRRLAELGGVKP